MKGWSKEHKRRAAAEDLVPCKVALNINVADPMPGPKSEAAMGKGLGSFGFVGVISPEKAAAILDILWPDGGLDDEVAR